MGADKLPKLVIFWGSYPSLIGLIFILAMFGPFTVKKNYLLTKITVSRALHSYCIVVQVNTPAILYESENLNKLLISVKGIIMYCTLHHSIFSPLNSTDITQINRKSCSQLEQMWKLLHRLLHVTSCFNCIIYCISNITTKCVSFLDFDVLCDMKFTFSYGTSRNLCWQGTTERNGKHLRGKRKMKCRVFFNVIVIFSAGLWTGWP
jgi:hypothetical protein